MRYATFPDRHRIVVEQAGTVTVYDSGDHRISGVSQQQSGTQDLRFTARTAPSAQPTWQSRGTEPGWRPVGRPPPLPQWEIASSARLFTAGPMTPMDSMTISMLPAMNMKTPVVPNSRRKNAMKKALNTTEIRLNE